MQKSWERRKGEAAAAYKHFLAYRDMGLERSLEAVRDHYGETAAESCSLRNLEGLSTRHNWVERARQWDVHLQRARDREAAKDAARWERRKLEELESVWVISQNLRRLVNAGMKFPLERRTVEAGPDGKSTTIVEPMKWSLRDLAAIAEISVRLAAAALAAVAQDPTSLSDVELEAVMDAGLGTVGGDE